MDGNIHNLQDALEWLDRSIREEAELDGEMSNEHAIQLGFIQNMLTKFPCRNCDVGTADEQYARHDRYCESQSTCEKCLERDAADLCVSCFANWAQKPYEEGGAK